MKVKNKRPIAILINVALIVVIAALRYSGAMTFKIGSAVPVILLPVIISVSMFFSDNVSIVLAVLAGGLTDSMSTDSSWFNTLFFVCAAAICNLLLSRFFNRNLKAAVYVSTLVSLLYFFLKYLIFFIFQKVEVNYDYFILYLIPSIVYTAVWIVPLYFMQKKLSN